MLFTIGTSNRSLCEFLHELHSRSITQIIDVRSHPYSRLGHFCRPAIERWAAAHGLFYRPEGASLGGRSGLSAGSGELRDALYRLQATSMREKVAVFCAEGDPAKCHRSYLVAAAFMAEFGEEPINILRDGSDEPVTKTLARTDVSLLTIEPPGCQSPLPF